MFRSLRRNLLDLLLFLYRSEFRSSAFVFLPQEKAKLKTEAKMWRYLGWAWLRVHPEEEVSLVSGNTKTVQMENTSWFSFTTCLIFTSFSNSSSLTKLSGKTPCLPPISPIHQPASAQSCRNIQPHETVKRKYENRSTCLSADLGDDVEDIALFNRQLVFILCLVGKQDFTLFPSC